MDNWRDKEVYGRDDKSGWTWKMWPLADFNFNRLNHDIEGMPIYFNQDRVWPKPTAGATVLWDKTNSLPDVRNYGVERDRGDEK